MDSVVSISFTSGALPNLGMKPALLDTGSSFSHVAPNFFAAASASPGFFFNSSMTSSALFRALDHCLLLQVILFNYAANLV